jgi:hypothetical protein
LDSEVNEAAGVVVDLDLRAPHRFDACSGLNPSTVS